MREKGKEMYKCVKFFLVEKKASNIHIMQK